MHPWAGKIALCVCHATQHQIVKSSAHVVYNFSPFSCFLVVHSSSQCWIFQCSPAEWPFEWTSDLDWVNSIVYSCGSSQVQLFKVVPRVLQNKGVQPVPVSWLHQAWGKAFVMKEFTTKCYGFRFLAMPGSLVFHTFTSSCLISLFYCRATWLENRVEI